MRGFPVVFFLFFPMVFYSCSSEVSHKNQQITKRAFDTTFQTGVVTAKVNCKTDTNLSYALFLPASYKTSSVFSVVIYFDSHAKGILAVEKYKKLADSFGYIIASSNNSKNGMSTDVTNAIGKALKYDLLQRFSIDKERMYAAGFSGGARVAGALASADSTFAGVIGCSAGIALNNLRRSTFNFVGIAGLNDMNYNELVVLDKTLEKSNFHHIFLTFDGKHEWAPVETMHEAFLWLHVSAVKNKITEQNKQLIKEFESANIAAASAAKEKNNNLDALNLYKKLVLFLNGISDINAFQKEITSLENLQDVKSAQKEKEKSESKEQALQQAYMEALQTKDIEWWKTEVAKLNDKINNETSKYEKAMFNRVFGFLSLAAFSYVNRALQMNDLKMAEHFNEVYLIVDPIIADQRFFAACIFAQKGDAKNVINSLHEAVKFGLTDVERIRENVMLKPFVTNKEIDKIIEEIKQHGSSK